MAGIGAAVKERGRRLVPERRPHPAAHDHGAERHVAGADSLRAGDQVGREGVPLAAEPASEAAEAGDDLVADEEHIALPADPLDRRPVALGRRDRPAGADHRLADEGGDAAVELVDDTRELCGIVVGDLGDVADQRAVAVAHGRDPGERGAVGVRAVIGEAARDDHRPLRLPDERPVATDDLGSCIDRLAAAGAKKDGGVGDGRELGDAPRQLQRGLVGMVTEDVVGSERAKLVTDRVGDLHAAVTDVREPEPRGRVEILVSVRVPDATALAAGEDELVPLDLAHRGERVPEARRLGHRPTLTGSRVPGCCRTPGSERDVARRSRPPSC